jgi:transposase InsO family protein
MFRSPESAGHGRNAQLRTILCRGTRASPKLADQRGAAREACETEDPFRADPSQEVVSKLPDYLKSDDFANRILEGLIDPASYSDSEELTKWEHRDNLLWRDRRLYVPDHQALRLAVLAKHHDDPLAGHFATRRTRELVERKFWWPDLSQFVSDYCDACGVCQGSRVIRGKKQGLLQPLEIPARPWEQISMDFIVGLPASSASWSPSREVYDAILVIIDRFSKMGHFVPTFMKLDAEQLANVFIKGVLRLHGIPTHIVTDRGSLFTSAFWSDFMYLLRVRRALSTSYHPQTDGQTERLNSVLEQYLRSFVNYEQDNWVDFLPLAEFAYNNSKHATTGETPFRVVTGMDPRTIGLEPPPNPDNIETKDAPAYHEHAERLRTNVYENLQKAREYQERQYNRKKVAKTFNIGC